jgi:L-aspartate oxidase
VVRARFPNIAARCALGLDLTREPIPVVPAAHYMCGGVRATLAGRTALDGLLALGRGGVHRAPRRQPARSNSLLEALVGAPPRAARGARALAAAPRRRAPSRGARAARGRRSRPCVFDHNWDAVRRVMWDLVGIVRTDARLAPPRAGSRCCARHRATTTRASSSRPT